MYRRTTFGLCPIIGLLSAEVLAQILAESPILARFQSEIDSLP